MLPGRLCIGILEEDNPLKSYFRLKPLLVEEGGAYLPFTEGERFPEEGCIRIVPDKNESSHFKARMRRMGRYCVLDLREHTGESDKIRPNKNYHGDESEKNAFIVYSDVVREPAPNLIFEIAENLTEGPWPAPGTPRLIAPDGLDTWAYSAPEEEGGEGRIAPDGQALDASELARFELEGFSGETLRFAIRLPSALCAVAPAPQPAPRAEKSAPQPPVEEPAPAEPEKPWITSAPAAPPAPPVSRMRMSPLQQALAAQSGLNPRHNRSLREVVEDKWKHSRVDQLGHPVPGKAASQPMENPLERAMDALRAAWNMPELRDRLVENLAEMAELNRALDSRVNRLTNSSLRRELEDLEAERLKTLDELDTLRREKRNLREKFKQEVREEEAEALREAVERTREAQAERARQEALAADARRAAECAQDAFAALSDGRFEEKLMDFAITSRAAQLIAHSAPAPQINCAPLTREEWISRMQRAAAMEGLELSPVQAASLLVSAALSDCLMISGPASSDKDGLARAIARALGAWDAGRCACDAHLSDALRAESALPAVALLREANAAPDAPLDRGLCGAADHLIVISTVADSGAGYPLSPEALDRGFLIRMSSPAADSPWKRESPESAPFAPASLKDLRAAFLTDAELPAALERRLQRVRDALAKHGVRLSRHTLDLMWRYCAAMLEAAKISPGEALDLALAQKALPCAIAEAPLECLMELGKIFSGMPHCIALLDAPLPILI